MKKTFKKIALAGVFACALTAGAFGAATVTAAAEDVDTTNAGFKMVEGASLRLEDATKGVEFGMRFKTEVNKAWYDTLVNPQVVTLLLPTDMLEDAALEANAYTAAVAVDVDEEKKYVVGANTETETYRFNVVLKDVPDDEYATEISARSYITADNLTTPLYTPLATDSYSSTARSVVKVADSAINKDIEDGTDKYSAVDKYLVSGITANGTGLMLGGAGGYLGAKLAYNDGVSEDVQTRLDAKYPLAYASDNESAATIDENGKLTAGDTEGTANVTVSNAALGLTKTVAVKAYTPTYGELINFDAIDWTTITNYNNPVDLKVVSNGEKQAISYQLDGRTVYQTYIGFSVYDKNSEEPEWFVSKRFDKVTVTIEMTKEEGTDTSGHWLFLGTESNYEEKASGHQFENVTGEDMTFTFAKDTYIWQQFYRTNRVNIFVKQRNQKSAIATFVVKNVSLGINDIANSTGSTVNLNEKFYVDGTNNTATYTFTPTGGTATAIDNPTAFAATQDGVITATISADGYKAGTLEANYDFTKIVPYGQLVDFTDIDMTGMVSHAYPNTATNLNNVTIGNAVSPVSEKNALFVSLNTAGLGQSTQSTITYGIKIPMPAWASNFDTITYTVDAVIDDIDESEGGTTETATEISKYTLRIPASNTTNRTYNGTTKTLTYSVDSTKVGDYIYIGGQISQKSYDVIATIYITDIKFGYSDIAYTEGGDALDLTAELGSTDCALTADEVSATFTPTDGEAAAVADVTAFTPTTSGSLVVTITKEGYFPATFTIPVTYTAAATTTE